jgi:Ni2+-binding GTPase involved in maturation of urease and hydrogenase
MESKDSNRTELIVLVGLPGSGKTTYLKSLITSGEIEDYCDDYEYGPIKRLNPMQSEEDERLINGLRRKEKWAVADTRYCDKKERAKLETALKQLIPNLKLKFLFFENRPDLCVQNATYRNKFNLPRHEINLIYYYTDLYEIPEEAKVIKIASGQTTP